MPPIEHRYDFVYLFDVQDGNPNGDPDAGNLPRLDPEDGHGLVTDVCLKRKVRNFIAELKGNEPPYELYVQERSILNLQHKRGYDDAGVDPKKMPKKDKAAVVEQVRSFMCKNFYDIRTFGAVMGTEVNAGQVLGPVQLTFARSLDRIVPAEHSITRMAVTTEREAEAQEGGNRTMGRKATIPYGLYRSYGFVNVPPARKSGFSGEDLDLFWQALGGMFDLDRSAARGMMAARALFVFEHESALGNARAAELFERISVSRNGDGPPRAFADYEVSADTEGLPSGVHCTQLL